MASNTPFKYLFQRIFLQQKHTLYEICTLLTFDLIFFHKKNLKSLIRQCHRKAIYRRNYYFTCLPSQRKYKFHYSFVSIDIFLYKLIDFHLELFFSIIGISYAVHRSTHNNYNGHLKI